MRVNFLSVFFCIFSVAAQLVLLSSAEYIFSTTPFLLITTAATAAILFLLADILNERYGLRVTIFTIIAGVLLQALVLYGAMMSGREIVFSIASFSLMGLLVGDLADAVLYAWMKKQTGARLLALRTFLSTTAAIVIESAFLVFAAPALMFVVPQFIGKFVLSLVNIPITTLLDRRSLRDTMKS
jgi:uncharacterized PurR-regulated membrane protein YhhQ (DUF165 family)